MSVITSSKSARTVFESPLELGNVDNAAPLGFSAAVSPSRRRCGFGGLFFFFFRANQISSEGCQERICQLSSIMEQPEPLLSPPASSCIIHCRRLQQRDREWGKKRGEIGVLCDYLQGEDGEGKVGPAQCGWFPLGGLWDGIPLCALFWQEFRKTGSSASPKWGKTPKSPHSSVCAGTREVPASGRSIHARTSILSPRDSSQIVPNWGGFGMRALPTRRSCPSAPGVAPSGAGAGGGPAAGIAPRFHGNAPHFHGSGLNPPHLHLNGASGGWKCSLFQAGRPNGRLILAVV